MNRRNFLSAASKSLSLMTLAPFLHIEKALANAAEKRFFVQIDISGGWDVTLCTDPWLKSRLDPSEIFIEYSEDKVKKIEGLYLGPAMSPMAAYASNVAIINGIFLSELDNGHGAASSYMLTGTTETNWGSLAVEYAETLPEASMGVLTGHGEILGNRYTKTTPTYSMSSFRNNALSNNVSNNGSLLNLRDMLARNLQNNSQKIELFKNTLAEFEKQGEQISDMHYIAASLKAGLSQIASFKAASGNLDTHAGHEGAHLTALTEAWSKIAKMLSVFKSLPYDNTGESLYDRTTFQIVSEFSRTAALNPGGGKDHNPICNSSVLIDSRIHSTVVGGSHVIPKAKSKYNQSYHIASPINLATGQPTSQREGSFIIRPENVAATVFDLLGVSRRRIPSIKPKTQSLIGLIKPG